MLSPLKKLFVICVNAGWIVPFYLCVNTLIQWCRLEALPLIHGGEHHVNSFPFLGFSQDMLVVTCVWLAAAAIFNPLLRPQTVGHQPAPI